jgi:hypothetical protein
MRCTALFERSTDSIRFDSIGQRARPAGMSLDEFARKQRRGGQCAAERDAPGSILPMMHPFDSTTALPAVKHST